MESKIRPLFPALLCIAAVHLTKCHQGILIGIGVALLIQVAGTMLPAEMGRKGVSKLLRQDWYHRSVENPMLGGPSTSSVACFGGHRTQSYVLYRPDYSREVVYLRSTSSEELIEGMKEGGASFLYARPRTREQRRVINTCVSKGWLQVIDPGPTKVKGRFYSLTKASTSP